MGLSVRERPPLNLDIGILTPSGGTYRWGADDPKGAKKPDGLTFSSAMPGGFESLSCSLERDPRFSWPDTEELSTLTVRGLGGSQIAWEGRLEKLPDTGGQQAQLNPQAVGWQSHLDDDASAAEVYVDRDLTRWGDPSLTRQIALAAANIQVGSASVSMDPASNNPALVQSITDSWVSPFKPAVESWYDAGPGNVIGAVYYDYVAGAGAQDGAVNWSNAVSLSSDANAGSVWTSSNLNGAAERTGYFSPGVATQFALLASTYIATPAGAQGAQYNAYWKNVAVYGNTGVIGRGPDPVGVFASDVVAHALGRWAPLLRFTSGPDGTIQPSTFVIPQLVFTPTTTSQIVKAATQYELLDWAVWENKTFWLNARGSYGRARHWRTRVAPAQLQQTGPDVSRIWNGVTVTFQDAATGLSGTAGPPGSGAMYTDPSLADGDQSNPVNQIPGLRRYAPLQMLGSSTSAGAIKTGAVFLQEQKLLNTSGQAALVGHVQDDHGVFWPAWMVRAGDTCSVIDASDPSPRRIVHTSYDDPSKTNTIQLDQPPDSLGALLARLSVVLSPIGLS